MVRKLTIRETFESNRSVIDTLLNLGFEDNGTGKWSKYYPKDSFRVCIIPETGDCYISMNASSMEIDSRLKPVNTPESVSEIDRLANISFSKLSEPVNQYVSRMKKDNDFVNGVWVRKDAGKREAVSRKRSIRSSGTKANSVGRFLDNMIERGKIDEKQVTVVFDKNNNIMWLGKAGFYPLFMSNIEYRSSGYDADHPHEFWINARSYTTPFEESFKRNRVTEDLEWEIIHDSDDESGNPTLWSARIDSDRYGKFIWIEKSDIGYDVVCRSGSDNWYVLDSFKSLGRAKRYVDDLLDDIDELEEAKSVEDYSHLKESGRYDYFDVPDGSFDIHDDIPDEPVDTKSKDYFNFVVNDVMTRCKDEREARRYMRAKGLPKSFIDDVIKEIDRIYD